jgi:hypothetical protein
MTPGFTRGLGIALAAGGALTLLLNVVLTPLMPQGVPFAQAVLTPVFLWRESASALAVALLLVGSMGFYLDEADRVGAAGMVAFLLAFLGSALVLAWEWANVFVLRDLARVSPAALGSLDASKGMSLYTLGAIIPLSLFTLGWLALAISTMRAGKENRVAAAVLIAGFFVGPIASAALGAKWGGALGSATLGVGWMMLGVRVASRAAASGA